MHRNFERIMLSDPIQPFFDAWQQARVKGLLPNRVDIQLKDFAAFAENIAIYERRGPRDFFYRLQGSQIAERLEYLDRGFNFFDFISADTLEMSELWWNSIIDRPCGGVLDYSTRYPNGDVRETNSVLLPIVGQDGECQILALNIPGKLLRIGDRTPHPRVAEDYVYAHYLDIGFGIPDGQEAYWALKPREDETFCF